MKKLLIALCLIPVTGLGAQKEKSMFHQVQVKDVSGKPVTLEAYKGKVLLVVNTASECGFTPQYAGLEALYQKYKAKGFEVLAFPSNDFGGQEPGTEAEIKKFCELKYKTTFPLFSKAKVKENADPLFALLQKETGEKVAWNFGKFLVNKEGKVVKYYPSKVEPMSAELTKAIEAAL